MAFIEIKRGKRFTGGSAAAPSLAFGDGDTGFYESVDDTLRVSIGGSLKGTFSSGAYTYIGTIQTSTGSGMLNETPSATNPTFIPNTTDTDTGIGWAGADQLALVAGAVEALRLTENGGILFTYQTTAGITAHTGSSQGDGPLTSSHNEISVCANGGDAVTLPSAVAGYEVTIINNGAQACDVFPATDDNIGAGADTAVSLAAGANITYIAYDVVNWATKV